MAPPYLFPHICFGCRLCFKRVARENVGEVLCPRCRKAAHPMARKFQAPPRSDLDGWHAVQLLYRGGWRGHGWNVSPKMSLREVEKYLAEKPEHERAAQTARKQEKQNEAWRKMRKWPRIHREEKPGQR